MRAAAEFAFEVAKVEGIFSERIELKNILVFYFFVLSVWVPLCLIYPQGVGGINVNKPSQEWTINA